MLCGYFWSLHESSTIFHEGSRELADASRCLRHVALYAAFRQGSAVYNEKVMKSIKKSLVIILSVQFSVPANLPDLPNLPPVPTIYFPKDKHGAFSLPWTRYRRYLQPDDSALFGWKPFTEVAGARHVAACDPHRLCGEGKSFRGRRRHSRHEKRRYQGMRFMSW